jgi:predicted RNA-binding Zn-ribbon protein involved in translation (DUF1610 family)
MAGKPDTLPVAQALAIVTRWRREPDKPIKCPLCSKGPLALRDHSARPHAEWYRLVCDACGLDQSLHIPMSTPIVGLD